MLEPEDAAKLPESDGNELDDIMDMAGANDHQIHSPSLSKQTLSRRSSPGVPATPPPPKVVQKSSKKLGR